MTTAFEQEWAGIKAEVSGDSGMRLASAEGKDGGGDSGGVKSRKLAWTTAGTSVGAIGGAVRAALKSMEQGQGGDSGFDPLAAIPVLSPNLAATGVQSLAAQREVYSTWKRYLKDVAVRCEVLEAQMGKAGSEFAGSDREIAFEFGMLNDGYGETPGRDGKGKG